MKRIKGGKLEVNSAYEAHVLARAAMYGKKDEIPTIQIKHDPELKNTTDEVEFLKRSIEFKKDGSMEVKDPVLKPETVQLALSGLKAIVETGKPHRNVTPHEARTFLEVYEEQEEGPTGGLQKLSAGALALRVSLHYPPETSPPPPVISLAPPPPEQINAIDARFERAAGPLTRTA